MPRREDSAGFSDREKLKREDVARVAIQTTKLLCSYRREFADLVRGHDDREISAALRRARAFASSPMAPSDASKLEAALHRLAGCHWLRCGPVDPRDPNDGLDAADLQNVLGDPPVVLDDPDQAPMHAVLGVGDWRLVWIDKSASFHRICQHLKDLGFGGQDSSRDTWDDTWGAGNGFSYLILRRSGESREEALAHAFGKTPFRKDSFAASLKKAMDAARRHMELRRRRDAFERHGMR